jgi:O-methyltransferase
MNNQIQKPNAIGPDQQLYLDLLRKSLTASIYEESAWKVVEAKPSIAPDGWNPARPVKNWFRQWTVRQLQKRSLMLVRRHAFDAAVREDGGDWPCFGFTMIGHRGLGIIQRCVEDVLVDGVPGDFIETGAWRGGATIYMRALLRVYGITDRVVWVADSFEGLPAPEDAKDGWDMSHVQHLKMGLDRVKSNFARFGLLDDQVRFLQGWFKDTLPTAPIQKIALLRLDGDLYSSTMDSLSNLYSKVSPGGYVIVDDYFSWPSCKRAVDEFMRDKKITADIQGKEIGKAYWRVPAA